MVEQKTGIRKVRGSNPTTSNYAFPNANSFLIIEDQVSQTSCQSKRAPQGRVGKFPTLGQENFSPAPHPKPLDSHDFRLLSHSKLLGEKGNVNKLRNWLDNLENGVEIEKKI